MMNWLFTAFEFKKIALFTSAIQASGILLLVAFLLLIGRRVKAAITLEKFGIPVALVFGLIFLLIGPNGSFHFLPKSITDTWLRLPTVLLTVIFSSLMLCRPLPNLKSLFKPVVSQAMLGLFLGFGQYLVGGLVVIYFLSPYFGVDPLMSCLIEVGFEGGHGAASVMGDIFNEFGFKEGLDLGLAMATVGLLASTILGSVLIVLGRSNGWLSQGNSFKLKDDFEEKTQVDYFDRIKELLINFLLIGLASLIGFIALFVLQRLGSFIGGSFNDFTAVFPVFPLALFGSLLIRIFIDSFFSKDLSSEVMQREISTLSTDLLIITAIASLNLKLLSDSWLILTILSICGLTWNLFGMIIYAKFVLNEEWFERSLVEFGNSTGVAASALLLLRLVDPQNNTETLPIFSFKQLFLQPILSGGIITVISPFIIQEIGLKGWTLMSGILSILFVLIAILFSNYSNRLKLI